MNRVEQYLAKKIEERRLAGNLRQLTTHRAPADFFSNDYLGLVTTGALASLMHQSFNEATTGSTGSRLLSGNSVAAETLEATIAAFHKAEAALLFNSGYDANLGLLSSIVSRNTTILYDELCHASLIDGIRLSQCNHKYRFAHNDTKELAEKLEQDAKQGPTIVVVESIYSMDGDTAPLLELVELCEQYEAQLIVDEAHATGVIGKHGEGLVCTLGLQDKVFARVHTFGKALGCHGAAIVGGNMLKQYLVNFARSFIYTTALPGHSIHAAYAAYQHLSDHNFTNAALHELIAYFREQRSRSEAGQWIDSSSPIQALIVGENGKCRRIAEKLQHAGLQINAILSPTVPAGKERLRVCLHTFNTHEQIDRLFAVLSEPVV